MRDQIHSYDVIQALWAFAQNPRPGEVYNLGGGRANSASVLECVAQDRDAHSAASCDTRYHDQARKGDHICYISDLTKLQTHYPEWRLTRSLDQILEELVRGMSPLSNAHLASEPRDDAATPHLVVISGKKTRVQAFYDELGADWEQWVARSRYYHDSAAAPPASSSSRPGSACWTSAAATATTLRTCSRRSESAST